jgi:hypothetical protein
VKPRNASPAWNGAGILGVPSRWSNGEGHVGIGVLEHIDVGLPGVGEDGHARKECAVKVWNHSRVASVLRYVIA